MLLSVYRDKHMVGMSLRACILETDNHCGNMTSNIWRLVHLGYTRTLYTNASHGEGPGFHFSEEAKRRRNGEGVSSSKRFLKMSESKTASICSFQY